MSSDVHTEHCCLNHGCKYGDPHCTVTTGKYKQSYPCERCEHDDEMFNDLLPEINERLLNLEEEVANIQVQVETILNRLDMD